MSTIHYTSYGVLFDGGKYYPCLMLTIKGPDGIYLAGETGLEGYDSQAIAMTMAKTILQKKNRETNANISDTYESIRLGNQSHRRTSPTGK